MRTIMTVAGAALILSIAGTAQAAEASWNGPYAGIFAGLTKRQENVRESVRFDTNLDGAYADQVSTAAGANAFGPGFCSGSYLGNSVAGGCKDDDRTNSELGVRVGYDRQYGDFVVGVVGDYSTTQLQDSVTAFSTTPASYNFTRKLKNVFAARLRGGLLIGENNLFYATGGYAYGDVKHSFVTTNTANQFTRRGTKSHLDGYQFGLGAERKVTPNITIGGEWLVTRFVDDKYIVRSGNTGTTAATNPFLLVNANGTDLRRSNSTVRHSSFRFTTAYHF